MPITRVKKADAYTSESVEEEFVAEDPSEPSETLWERAKARAAKVGGDDTYLRITDKPSLFAFIVAAPIDDFDEHWVTSSAGRRSYRCLESDCPLCRAGVSKTSKFSFFVLHYDLQEDKVTPKILQVGLRVFRQLIEIDEDPRQGGPLAGNFFSIKKIGEKQQTQYIISPVRGNDLEDVWEISKEAALQELERVANETPPSGYTPTREELVALAEEISGR